MIKQLFLALTFSLAASLCGAEFVKTETIPADALQIHQIKRASSVGDTYIIIAPDGKITLVDCGEIETAATTLIPALEKRGIFNIDQVIITHQHQDHWGGLALLLCDRRMKIGQIIWSPVSEEYITKSSPSEAGCKIFEKALLRLTARNHIPMIKVSIGDQIDLGSGMITTVIGAGREDIKMNVNCHSIVFRLKYGDFTMLFTGDMGFRQENYILKSKAEIRSDVLKVGHHAGDGSTGNRFLDAVSPKAAIANMPQWLYDAKPRVIEMLKKRSIPFFPCGKYGDIVVFSDGKIFGIVGYDGKKLPKKI